jgi:aromatic amino acid transport protein AroP
MVVIVVGDLDDPDVRASVYAIPVWLLIIYGFYRIRLRTGQPLATQR